MGKPLNRKKNNDEKNRDPIIIAALIGLAGTVVTALLASPAINRLIEKLGESTSTPLISTSMTEAVTSSANQIPNTGNHIQLNQTVTGTLYYNEAGVWIFSDGPAVINIILDVGPYGEALIILRDPDGVDRAYVDSQGGREERLINFEIPDEGEYSILVRNSLNTQVDYTLTLEDATNANP